MTTSSKNVLSTEITITLLVKLVRTPFIKNNFLILYNLSYPGETPSLLLTSAGNNFFSSKGGVMTIKKKMSIGILTLVCGVMLLFAFEVFSTATGGKLMPLMEESIGKSTSEINAFSPVLLSFIFTLLKVIPALLFSLIMGVLILLYGPFKTDKKWASIAIFTPLIFWLISAIFIYRALEAAPWQLWLILLILVILALTLSLTDKKKII